MTLRARVREWFEPESVTMTHIWVFRVVIIGLALAALVARW